MRPAAEPCCRTAMALGASLCCLQCSLSSARLLLLDPAGQHSCLAVLLELCGPLWATMLAAMLSASSSRTSSRCLGCAEGSKAAAALPLAVPLALCCLSRASLWGVLALPPPADCLLPSFGGLGTWLPEGQHLSLGTCPTATANVEWQGLATACADLLHHMHLVGRMKTCCYASGWCPCAHTTSLKPSHHACSCR